ncbi:MAG: VTC domain-containing protein [[Eubacterium] siraeum]
MIYRERALRHEYKFPATAAQCEILRERFSAVMTPDAHGENGCYRITSVYLDDVYRTAYNDKLIGADTRKKYRIRTYDLSDKLLHFECKYKDRDMTSKRGIWISPEQYYSILRGDYSLYGAVNMRVLSLRTHLTAIRWLCSARLL